MRNHRDDTKRPTLSIGENLSRTEQAIASSWSFWLSVLYTPIGFYLAFGIAPIIRLLGMSTADNPNLLIIALLLEIVVWIGLPFVAGIYIHNRVTKHTK